MNPRRPDLSFLALTALVTLLELNHVLAVLEPNLAKHMQEGPNILAGTPRILAFQSRLLGAAMQGALERIGLPRNHAFFGAVGVLVVVLNALFLPVARDRLMLPFYAIFSLFWVACLDPTYFYAWDLIDTGVFLVLVFIMLGRAPDWAVFPLFVVALLNRESAAYIGLWLIIGDKRRPWLGVSMILATLVFAVLARHALLIHAGTAGSVGGNSMNLWRNLAGIADVPHWPMRLPLAVGLIAGGAWCAWMRTRLSLFVLALLCADMVLGVWFEFRIYMMLAPMVAIMVTRAGAQNPRPTIQTLSAGAS